MSVHAGYKFMYCIGGSRGRARSMSPPWDPILSFLHALLPKSGYVRGPRPPLTGPRPSTGNPGSATVLTDVNKIVISRNCFSSFGFTPDVQSLKNKIQ